MKKMTPFTSKDAAYSFAQQVNGYVYPVRICDPYGIIPKYRYEVYYRVEKKNKIFFKNPLTKSTKCGTIRAWKGKGHKSKPTARWQ